MNIRRMMNRIVYGNDYQLINSPAKKDMDYFIVEALFGTMFMLLTSGIFLSGYLIYLGASDIITSFLPQIINICGVFLVFFTKFVARKERRRTLVIFLCIIAKLTLFSIIIVPIFFSHEVSIPIVYFLLIVGYSLNSIYNLALNTWFVGVIPLEIRGRYYSTRQIFCILLSTIVPVISGKALDMFENEYLGFWLMYSFALIASIIQTATYIKISDPIQQKPENSFKIRDVFIVPFKDKEFFKFTLRICAFQVLLNMSFSFSQIFMLKYLGLSYTYITLLGMFNAILQAFVFFKLWGILTDRLGANFVMLNCLWFFAFDALGWVFMTPERMYILLPICYAFGSINGSGYMVGSFNRRYELIKEKDRVLYESFFVTMIGLAFLLAPFLGAFLRVLFEDAPFLENILYGNFRIVYLFSVISIVIIQVFYLRDIRKNDPKSACLKKGSYKYAMDVLKKIVLRRSY